MPHRLKVISWSSDKGKYNLQDTEEIVEVLEVKGKPNEFKLVIKEWYKE